MSKWPLFAYAVVMVASRLAFRHRECVPTDGGQDSSAKRQGALLCLLPLALMQLGPLMEYWLRYEGFLPAGPFEARQLNLNSSPGLLVFIVGTGLAALTSRQLAWRWREHPGSLVTTGLYSAIRHPMYAGYLVQGAGCALMLSARWSWILYGAATALIFARTVLEDRELLGRFPEEFPPYAARVKRLIPKIF